MQPKQLLAQLNFRLFGYTEGANFGYIKNQSFPLIKVDWKFPLNCISGSYTPETDCFMFLNRAESANTVLWGGVPDEPLWNYQLHYFEWLFSEFQYSDQYLGRSQYFIQSWCTSFGQGEFSLEPYPTSRRLVSWVKYYIQNKMLPECNVLNAMIGQSQFLSKNIENHITGNHLISNYKAMIFVGIYFHMSEMGRGFFNLGITGLIRELKIQVLEDGCHFELSPMYHCMVLVDLIETHSLMELSLDKISEFFSDLEEFSFLIQQKIDQMISYITNLTAGITRIPFINDSCERQVLPLSDSMFLTASRVGDGRSDQKDDMFTPLSGLWRVSRGSFTIIFNVSKFGPDSVNGHSHADTLSFELWFGGRELFVNGGVSTYHDLRARKFERSSAFSNGLTFNGESSSEIWGKFRSGRMHSNPEAVAIKSKSEISLSGYIRIALGNGGFANWFRNISLQSGLISVTDQVVGTFSSIKFRLRVHPEVKVISSDGSSVYLESTGAVFKVTWENYIVKLRKSYYSPEFGKRVSTHVLEFYGRSCGRYNVVVEAVSNG